MFAKKALLGAQNNMAFLDRWETRRQNVGKADPRANRTSAWIRHIRVALRLQREGEHYCTLSKARDPTLPILAGVTAAPRCRLFQGRGSPSDAWAHLVMAYPALKSLQVAQSGHCRDVTEDFGASSRESTGSPCRNSKVPDAQCCHWKISTWSYMRSTPSRPRHLTMLAEADGNACKHKSQLFQTVMSLHTRAASMRLLSR